MDISDREYSRYHCTSEWHLAQLVCTPFAAILYPFAYHISKKSGRFHGSVVGIADHFAVSRWKVQRAGEALVELGFFDCLAREPFKPSVYHVVSHREWAAKHPDCCAVKETFCWSDEEGDGLGRHLWNTSGGKVKYHPYQIAALRKTKLSDDQVVEAFETFIAAENARRGAGGWHGRWGAVPYRFLCWLKGALPQGELLRLGLAPFCLPVSQAR